MGAGAVRGTPPEVGARGKLFPPEGLRVRRPRGLGRAAVLHEEHEGERAEERKKDPKLVRLEGLA